MFENDAKPEHVQSHNPQSHIEDLKKRRSVMGDNTTTVANMISQQMHQLFHDPKCFIYEIIQNAEDAEADSVIFKLDKNNLIISYNGKPFEEYDVERLCDASRDNDQDMRAKTKQADKIGYKGIGFKSVFGMASEITILSPKTQYFFKFSKSYWDNQVAQSAQEKQTRFPWQIIPLWLDSKSCQEVAEYPENVTIILQGIDPKKIVSELMTLVTLDERIIFLNKIRKIDFLRNGDHFSIQKFHEESLCKISCSSRNANFETLWFTHRANVAIEEDITEKLARLDLSSCPEKIKSAKTTDITFAVKLEKTTLEAYDFLPVKDNKLYCYLPTSIDCHLPFLINARFILSQDRGAIIQNPWNSFLLRSIAIEHVKWLAMLALNKDYSKNILKLFLFKEPNEVFPQLKRRVFHDKLFERGPRTSLLDSYVQGFSEAREKVAFVPSKSGDLLCLRECVVDSTCFFTEIDESILDENLRVNGRSRIVSYELTARDVLINFAQEYNFSDLLENIEQYFNILGASIDHIEIRSLMIMFILSSTQILAFFEKRILLCKNQKFSSPNETFVLSSKSNFELEFLDNLHINVAKLSLYNSECKKKLKKTLTKVSEESIIRIHVARMIQQDMINKRNSVAVLRFIYASALSNKATYSWLDELNGTQNIFSQFKVITCDNQMRVVAQCFLPLTDEDRKNYPAHQLSPLYFLKEDNHSAWKTLLIYARIITSTELTVKSISYGELEQFFKNKHQVANEILEYTKHVLDQVPNSEIPPVIRKDFKERLVFCNFIYFPFMFDLNDAATLSLFLKKLNDSHQIFSQTPRITGIKRGAPIHDIEICEHYLTYYFKNNILIKVKGTQKSKLAGSLFYLPELSECFEPGNISIELADLPQPISLATARFLGLRLSITLKEGLKLLSGLHKEISSRKRLEPRDFTRLNMIYRLLTKIDLSKEDISILPAWKNDNKLLSQTKELTAVNQLKVFDQSLDEGAQTPETKHWLHDAGLSNQELRLLAKIFDIPRYSEDNSFNWLVSTSQADIKLAQDLKELILSILPAIVLIERKEVGVDIFEPHKKLFNYFSTLEFIYCNEIVFDGGYKPRSFVRIVKDTLYMTGRNLHGKIGEVLFDHFQSKRAQEFFQELLRLFSTQNKNNSIQSKLNDIKKLDPDSYEKLTAIQTAKYKTLESLPAENPPSAAMLESAIPSQEKRPASSSAANLTAKEDKQTKKSTQVKPPSLFGHAVSNFDPKRSKVNANPVHIREEKSLKSLGNISISKDPSSIWNTNLEKETDFVAENEIENKMIGDRGEKIVFLKIIDLIEEQWGVSAQELEIIDPECGLSFSTCRFEKNDKILDVMWYNKNRDETAIVEESPVDIVISLNNIKKYFIEVKSTRSEKNPLFFLTTNEWEYMREKRKQSVLVRAYNVTNTAAQFEVYQDPFGMIFKDLISFMTGGKFRLKIKSREEAVDHIFTADQEIGCRIS